MSKQDFYILSSGKLVRKDNTLVLEKEEEETTIPIDRIDSIYSFSYLNFNSVVVHLLQEKNILLHFFSYYGYYNSTLFPKTDLVSGKIVIKQAKNYLDQNKRFYLAEKIIEGMAKNIIEVLRHYKKHGHNLKRKISAIKNQIDKIKEQKSTQNLLRVEGRIWSLFYSSFYKFLPEEFEMEKREKQPPTDPINAMISFGNSILYSKVLSQIYKTKLNPTISYLHEPSADRFSLSLDLAEIFKPGLVFKTIFKLINLKQIKQKHFTDNDNKCYLTDKGCEKFIRELDKRLDKTFHKEKLGRSISNETNIKWECYKLVNHLKGKHQFNPFLLSDK